MLDITYGDGRGSEGEEEPMMYRLSNRMKRVMIMMIKQRTLLRNSKEMKVGKDNAVGRWKGDRNEKFKEKKLKWREQRWER